MAAGLRVKQSRMGWTGPDKIYLAGGQCAQTGCHVAKGHRRLYHGHMPEDELLVPREAALELFEQMKSRHLVSWQDLVLKMLWL